MAKKQLDAKLTGFPLNLVQVWKGDYAAFKKYYDPKYKNLTAEQVWKSRGGTVPKK